MATSAASSEHFEKLHEIFRGLYEDLRAVPERLLGTAGTGEAGAGRAVGNAALRVQGGKTPALLPDLGPLLSAPYLQTRPLKLAGSRRPASPCCLLGCSGMDLGVSFPWDS